MPPPSWPCWRRGKKTFSHACPANWSSNQPRHPGRRSLFSTWSALLIRCSSRSEVVVTFLALLELIRLKQLVAVQREPFGEIVICRSPQPPDSQIAAAEEGSPRSATPDLLPSS